MTLADGGTVTLEWLGRDDPAATPTIVVLPTICGDGQTMRRTVTGLRRRRGGRIVVCNRRGHGDLPLSAPRFSTLGATDDVRAQLTHIRAAVPASPLYGLGVSAGSGLLVRCSDLRGQLSGRHYRHLRFRRATVQRQSA